MEYLLAQDESVVPGTESILAQYKEADIEGVKVANIKLSVVHHYELDAFRRSIESRMNVTTIARFQHESVGLILAQRR